ncbi:amino acid adenylation domain-containing protein, partial [Streptomyces sp. NPDC051320]|uniref:non-ribosomal peptide synthetase n=1 Tax=Streptomyces sp. NPDC051320 TaxID=3154644 RepID=UPI00341C3491
MEELNPTRSQNHHPLFQTMLVLQNQATAGVELPGVVVTDRSSHTGISKFDLTFSLSETHDENGAAAGLGGYLEFSTALFETATATSLADRLRRVLSAVVADPTQRVHDFELLDAQEQVRVLGRGSGEARPLPTATTPELFEAQALRTPDAPAVQGAGVSLSYAELNAQANGLAYGLRDRGVGPKDVVALAVPGADMVVAMLAVLKTGAAYLPVDPDYPASRITYMLDDARPAVLLTTSATQAKLPATPLVPVVALDRTESWSTDRTANPGVPLHPSQPAYVIYTSGSTGRPKGVVVTHASMTNHMAWMADYLSLSPDDRVLGRTSPSFDASVWEIWLPLLQGACVCVVSAAANRDPDLLLRHMRDSGVTLAQFVPSHLSLLLNNPTAAGPLNLRAVMSGGETLPAELAERVTAAWSAPLHNLYGPTEATIDTTACPVGPTVRQRGAESVPIGRPVRNARVYVLDAGLKLVPPGVVGELYVAGDGLARG